MPRPCKLTFDLLTLKVVSESRVTWLTSMPILVFLGLSVLDLCPMYATDRQTDVRRASSLNAPYPMGGAVRASGMRRGLLPTTGPWVTSCICVRDDESVRRSWIRDDWQLPRRAVVQKSRPFRLWPRAGL